MQNKFLTDQSLERRQQHIHWNDWNHKLLNKFVKMFVLNRKETASPEFLFEEQRSGKSREAEAHIMYDEQQLRHMMWYN